MMHCRPCRYIAKNFLFEEPVHAFLANGDNPNLLNSTFLEMMEFIRQADTKLVMLHFVDHYWPRVQHITYVRTFKLLKDAADNVRVRCHTSLATVATACQTRTRQEPCRALKRQTLLTCYEQLHSWHGDVHLAVSQELCNPAVPGVFQAFRLHGAAWMSGRPLLG